jgi:hypothetical protein
MISKECPNGGGSTVHLKLYPFFNNTGVHFLFLSNNKKKTQWIHRDLKNVSHSFI